jgi:hypothetical protein
MRTPVRFGVADGDGAIEVTSEAVGKVPGKLLSVRRDCYSASTRSAEKCAMRAKTTEDMIHVSPIYRRDLGKWIYGEGKAYQAATEYQNLKLHETAAGVVEIASKNNKAHAKAKLDSGTLSEASMKVINAISSLQELVVEWKSRK